MTSDLLIYLLKSSVVLTLFLIIYVLFLERETFFKGNRIFLLLGILISLLWPFFQITQTFKVFIPLETVSNSAIPLDGNIKTEVASWSVSSILIGLYVLGILLIAIRMLVQFYLLIGKFKNEKSFYNNGISYIVSNKVAKPFSFLSTIYINPQAYSKDDFVLIKLHEEAHVIQKHSYDVILIQLLCILQWFNPFCWMYRQKTKQNLEYLADQYVKERNSNLKNYQYLLLKNAIKHNQPLLVNTFFNSFIKKRIIMLTKQKSSKLHTLKYMYILPLLFIFTLLFNTKTKAQYIVAETATTQVQQEELSVIINKSTSTKELNAHITTFEQQGVILKFSGIKRNNADEIIAIKINLKDNRGENVTYSSKRNSPISPVKISYLKQNGETALSIEKVKETITVLDADNVETIVVSPGAKKIIIKQTNASPVEEDIKEIIKVKDSQKTKKKNYVIKMNLENVQTPDEGIAEEFKNATIIVNDEKVSYEDFKLISPDSIATVDIKKIKLKTKDSNGEKGENIIKVYTKKVALNSENRSLAVGSNSNEVYILIDNKEAKGGFELLSPYEIAYVEILDEKEATKRYGEKGKNGAILITTIK